MQDQRPSGKRPSDSDELHVAESGSRLVGQSQGAGSLADWAAATVHNELTRCADHKDKTTSDIALSSHPQASLPGWTVRALADESMPVISAASRSTVRSPTDQDSRALLDSHVSPSRAAWGPVEPPLIRSQLISVADSNVALVSATVAESVCSETSVQFDSKDLKPADHRHVSEESAETAELRHVCAVNDQHSGKETVSASEKRYVKMVPNQSVGSETTQVEDRLHLRMSSSTSATAESWEIPDRGAVKLVAGQHVSDETVGNVAAKPSVRLQAQCHATTETESSLLVCLVSI